MDLMYIIEHLRKITGVPIFIFTLEGERKYPAENSREDYLFREKAFRERMKMAAEKKICMYMDANASAVGYGSIVHEGKQYLVGPCLMEKLTVKQAHDFCKAYGVTREEFELPQGSMVGFASQIALLYHLLTGEKLDWHNLFSSGVDNLQVDSVSEDTEVFYQFDQAERGIRHYSMEEEREIFDFIRKGDVNGWDMRKTDSDMSRVGRLANNSDKQIEYMALSSLTLAARAAIEGGLSPAVAYGLSDLYHQKIEQCESKMELLAVQSILMRDFVVRVARSRKKHHRVEYIEQCENYLIENLYRPIRIGDVAREVGMNESYLSRRFAEEKGITMKAYLTRERLKGAANMLRFSKYSYAQIAEYCCFSSQSRFGDLFRKEYGMTPAQYRRRRNDNQLEK